MAACHATSNAGLRYDLCASPRGVCITYRSRTSITISPRTTGASGGSWRAPLRNARTLPATAAPCASSGTRLPMKTAKPTYGLDLPLSDTSANVKTSISPRSPRLWMPSSSGVRCSGLVTTTCPAQLTTLRAICWSAYFPTLRRSLSCCVKTWRSASAPGARSHGCGMSG
jgi:hypothetical protein